VRKALLLTAILALALCADAPAPAPKVVTLARLPTHVSGFAQSKDYLAWVGPTTRKGRTCDGVTFLELSTGRRTTVGPPRGDERCWRSGTGDDLVLAGRRAYWTFRSGSNLTYYSDLLKAAPGDRAFREVAFQSISNETSDILVSPASAGRDAYFWTSPQDSWPGPIVRYDGRTKKRVTSTIESLRALAAGGGRFAVANLDRRYDCAQEPALSPDGRRIAFSSHPFPSIYWGTSRTCLGGLWVMNSDGTDPVRIGDGRNPDWSPGGTMLAYSNVDGALMVSNADGSAAHTVVPQGADPSWAPSGDAIAFVRGTSIYAVAPDGSGERLLTANAADPDWSPDGTRLVFTRRESPGLGLVDADGTDRATLTTDFDSQPAWSPNGQKIAFVGCYGVHANCPNDDTDIEWVSSDGSGRGSLTQDAYEGISDYGPSWAPDSSQIVYARQQDAKDLGDSHIFVLPRRQLTRSPAPRTPVTLRTRAGRKLASFEPRAPVARLIVTSKFVAALEREDSGWQIETLAPVKRVVRLAHQPDVVKATGSTVVFAVGGSVYVFDARAGRPQVIAHASVRPIGLVIGRRVAWAENLRRGAWIRSFELP
jgi:Tol biopolymer transport system component